MTDPHPADDHFHQDEILRLRSEVADLATALNRSQAMRLMRWFHFYRLVRYKLLDRLLVWRARLTRQNTPGHENRVTSNGSMGSLYDLLLFSVSNWKWRYQRPQHLAVQYSRHGHRVFFISLDFSPPANPAYNNYPPRPYSISLLQENIWEVHLAAPLALNPLSRRLIEADVSHLMDALVKLHNDFEICQAVCLSELPFWAPLVLALRDRFGWKVIYDCLDRFYGVFPLAHSMLAEEAYLIRQANLVLCTARLLLDDLAGLNPNIFFLPNAADTDHFDCPAVPPPLDLAQFSRPILGYFGALNAWFDVELLAQVAANHPHWSIVLIGSGTANVDVLRQLPNVHLLGEKPYQELPGYLFAFDVCMIPFRNLSVIAATDPVKFYEYLAAGKPVVATSLPELSHYPGYVYLADNAEGFELAIQRALDEDTLELQNSRRQFAHQNDWETRYQRLHHLIQAMLQGQVLPSDLQVHRPKNSIIPAVYEIIPRTIRGNVAIGDGLFPGDLVVKGDGFDPFCQVLFDETPLETTFVSPQELRCRLAGPLYPGPGAYMVSVYNQNNWKHSNRRLFLVEWV